MTVAEREKYIWSRLPKHGKMRTLIQTGREGYSLGGPEYELTAGRITVEIPGTCAMVLKYFEE